MATGSALVNVPLFSPDVSLPQDHHQSCFVSGLQVIVTQPPAQGPGYTAASSWQMAVWPALHLGAQDYSLTPRTTSLWTLYTGIQRAAQVQNHVRDPQGSGEPWPSPCSVSRVGGEGRREVVAPGVCLQFCGFCCSKLLWVGPFLYILRDFMRMIPESSERTSFRLHAGQMDL